MKHDHEMAVVAAYFPRLRTWQQRRTFIYIITYRAWGHGW